MSLESATVSTSIQDAPSLGFKAIETKGDNEVQQLSQVQDKSPKDSPDASKNQSAMDASESQSQLVLASDVGDKKAPDAAQNKQGASSKLDNSVVDDFKFADERENAQKAHQYSPSQQMKQGLKDLPGLYMATSMANFIYDKDPINLVAFQMASYEYSGGLGGIADLEALLDPKAQTQDKESVDKAHDAQLHLGSACTKNAQAIFTFLTANRTDSTQGDYLASGGDLKAVWEKNESKISQQLDITDNNKGDVAKAFIDDLIKKGENSVGYLDYKTHGLVVVRTGDDQFMIVESNRTQLDNTSETLKDKMQSKLDKSDSDSMFRQMDAKELKAVLVEQLEPGKKATFATKPAYKHNISEDLVKLKELVEVEIKKLANVKSDSDFEVDGYDHIDQQEASRLESIQRGLHLDTQELESSWASKSEELAFKQKLGKASALPRSTELRSTDNGLSCRVKNMASIPAPKDLVKHRVDDIDITIAKPNAKRQDFSINVRLTPVTSFYEVSSCEVNKTVTSLELSAPVLTRKGGITDKKATDIASLGLSKENFSGAQNIGDKVTVQGQNNGVKKGGYYTAISVSAQEYDGKSAVSANVFKCTSNVNGVMKFTLVGKGEG